MDINENNHQWYLAPLLQRLSSVWLPNKNSHLARAIFCDRKDGVVAEPLSDCRQKKQSTVMK